MKRLQRDNCGFATALNAIGGKWKTLILWEINAEPRRFGELKRLLPGVSEKVLTQQLREMESDDLIHREVFPGAIQKVEYSVTEYGQTLNAAVLILSQWGKQREARLVLKNNVREARPSVTMQT